MKKILIILTLGVIGTTAKSQCWETTAAGTDHSIGLKSEGTLWAWGFNGSGQLGDGTTTEKNIPTKIGAASAMGQDVFVRPVRDMRTTLDLSLLESGVYVIRIRVNEKMLIRKIVKL